MKFKQLIYTLCMLSVWPFAAHAQESCTQTLVNAQEVFAEGQIEKVPDILAPCLESGFNRSERVAAYRLLTLCHLYYNHMDEATASMEKMLKLNPEYEIQDIDPSEFVSLHHTFRSNPVLIFGAKAGIAGLHIYDVVHYNDIDSKSTLGSYSPNLIYSAGISAETMLHDYFSISLDIFYTSYSFNYSKTYLEYATVSTVEKNTCIEAPLLLQWNILKNRDVIPYISIGGSLSYLIQAQTDLTRKDTLSGYSSREIALASPKDITSYRNALNIGLTGGVGVRIKNVIGNGYLSLDVRYTRYLWANMEAEDRASSDILTYNYMHTDNALKFENIQCLIGYKLPIYKPKQKRSVRKKEYN